jgi:putative transposase
MKYAFMAQHYGTWPVAVLCEVFDVSRSGFSAYWQRHAVPPIEHDEVALLARVKAIHAETRQRDGSRRMAKQLQADGFTVGRYKARRVRHQAGVAVRRPRQRHPMTTASRHRHAVAPDLLARQFDVAQPDQVWAGDITYLWTAAGWLSLAVLLEVYSRKGVGWAMRPHIDAALVQDALRMARGRRQPAAGLLHHAERGSQ